MNNYARRLALLNRDLDVAESVVDQIIDAFPQQSLFQDTKGMIYFSREKFEDAENLFDGAVKMDPKNPIYLEHLGDAQMKNGNASDALENWKLAKEYGSKSKNIDKKIADKKYYAPSL